MKKVIILSSVFAICAGVLFFSCGTTKSVTDDSTQQEIPIVKEEPKETEKKKPEDPPNVAFAKNLQKELESGTVKSAINLFDSLPSELENDTEMKMLLSSLYISDGQFDKATETANAVLTLDPENMEALEIVTLAAKASGNSQVYKQKQKEILTIDPYNASANIMIGDEYAMSRKYKLARDSYKKALKNEPENTDALFGYAQMSYYMDDLKSSKRTLEQLLDIDSENASALYFMGKLSAEESNYLRAATYVKKAIDIEPDRYDFWLDYGNYLRYQGKFADAATAWSKATEIDSTYFLAYAYLAGLYDEQDKFDLALQNYLKVIETNPQYFYAYEETAILEYHAGNYDQARYYFSKAYEYSKNYSYPLLMAVTYLKQNDSFNAKKVLTALLKTMDRESAEYNLVRFFNESYSRNAETVLIQKINKEDDSTKRGKMLFYMGLYYELNGAEELATEYYTKVKAMTAPMFFEYRFAEWSLGL
ncbi:MAG: tetratricopeptide repeat protein [Treponema sp.]|nr:tetratricopeptide repeat protein [Treponema sp.]